MRTTRALSICCLFLASAANECFTEKACSAEKDRLTLLQSTVTKFFEEDDSALVHNAVKAHEESSILVNPATAPSQPSPAEPVEPRPSEPSQPSRSSRAEPVEPAPPSRGAEPAEPRQPSRVEPSEPSQPSRASRAEPAEPSTATPAAVKPHNNAAAGEAAVQPVPAAAAAGAAKAPVPKTGAAVPNAATAAASKPAAAAAGAAKAAVPKAGTAAANAATAASKPAPAATAVGAAKAGVASAGGAVAADATSIKAAKTDATAAGATATTATANAAATATTAVANTANAIPAAATAAGPSAASATAAAKLTANEAAVMKLPAKVRPGLATQTADLVKFGILLKKWYGIVEAKGETSADVVITLHWTDPRVKKLIPAGAPSLRLPTKEAKAKIWFPDVKVTNMAHGGNDVISSSVKISSDGSVIQVDRLLLTVKQAIKTKYFPFDSQNVEIKLASGTYMVEELKLAPVADQSEWGNPTESNIFGNSMWHFRSQAITAFDDVNGELKKSRGVLSFVIKRSVAQFVSSVFMPSVVLLCLTWSAFWLPLGGAYTMPRIALNAFALLCQVSVSQMADGKIPATGDRAWMTDYLGLCIQLQFALALINVLIISIEHKEDGHGLALKLNDTMILSYPVSTLLNMTILVAGYVVLSRVCIAATLVGYLGYVMFSYKWHHEEKALLRRQTTPHDTKDDAPAWAD